MDWTLELIVVPVSDVDRAKAFYIDQAGFELLVDSSAGPDFRVVQLVPPGSACAIAIGTGIGSMPPGSLHGLHLVVSDIEAARDELIGRGTEVGEPSTSARPARRRASTPSGAATRRSCRSRIPTATPGSSRRSSATGRSTVVKLDRGRRVTERSGRVRRWGVRVRGPHRAIPARAPRPLLPDARLVRRGRGRGPGDVPAGVAGARQLRWQRARPGVAVQDRHERLPRRDPAQPGGG